ncbi:acyltransferase family protein [Gelidibacter algens]|nr:acyltransferase family protein [Gelidibacter algens]
MNLYDRKTITIAKALVIASVVLGHILEAMLLDGNRSGFVSGSYNSIYLVHMPFYFILSGWLFKGAQPKLKYLIKKSKHLLVPYAAWLIIFNIPAIAGFIFNLSQGNMVGEKLVFYQQHFLSQLYGGMAVSGIQMILWFPMCLFFTQQLANYILDKFEKHVTVITSITALFYTLAYVNQYFFPEFHLPLAINVVCGALPLFLLGYYIKKYPIKMSFFWGLIVFCLVICVSLFIYSYPLTYHMRGANYGIPIISILAALGGFFTVLLISNYLSRSKYVYSVSQPLGKASMTIMYLHALILVQIRTLDVYNVFWLLIAGILIPTSIHLAMGRVSILSKLFLGEDKNE